MAKTYLVLLDMNGTLCYRNEMPVSGVKEDLCIRRKYFYARGGIQSFVTELHASGHFCICPYSSMMAHNLRDGINAIFPSRTRAQCFHRLLDRTMNKPDPEGAEEWDTIRDVQKVWRALGAEKFGPKNTLLLDNEARKFQETPRNGIVVPEFGPAEVREGNRATLSNLLDYLLELGEEQPDDVREYMQQYPFRSSGNKSEHRGGKPTAVSDSSYDVSGLTDALLKTTIFQQQAKTDGSSHSATSPEDEAPGNVPKGTRLDMICLDGETFIMRNTKVGVTVKGRARKGLRVDMRMDYHRLLAECADCEVTRSPTKTAQ